ncbi:MAG: glycosyltransferase family 2 protein [Chloroflexi bacterium]|nr:glycosyltransferase family 2 protein [Chloroflexota bacterium]
MDLTILIPCCNEVDNVALLANELMPVVEQLRQDRTVEIIFVDDGSSDGTGDALAERFGSDPLVRIVRHKRNRGLGAALRTGFRYARGAVIVTTDSDATYPFPLITDLLDRLEPGIDIVTASCYHPCGGIENVPSYRVFLSKGASLLYRALVDRRVHTYTCLFRAYRRTVITATPFAADGFLAVTEILVRAMWNGYRTAELPCILRSRRHGQSKAKIVRTILAHLRFQSVLLRSRIAGSLAPAQAAGAGDTDETAALHVIEEVHS